MRLLLLLIIIGIILLLLLGVVIIIHLLESLYLLLQVGYQNLTGYVPLLSEYDER